MAGQDGFSRLGDDVSRSTIRGFSAARLRRAREARGWTARNLSDASGVSAQAISSWETGRGSPTPPTLYKVANALRMTVADFAPVPTDQMRLSDFRVQAGLTQVHLAAVMQVSPNVIGRLEHGRKPYDAEVATHLAEAYGVTASEVTEVWHRDVERRRRHGKQLRES